MWGWYFFFCQIEFKRVYFPKDQILTLICFIAAFQSHLLLLLLCESVLVLIYHVTFGKIMCNSWLYNCFSHKVVRKQRKFSLCIVLKHPIHQLYLGL